MNSRSQMWNDVLANDPVETASSPSPNDTANNTDSIAAFSARANTNNSVVEKTTKKITPAQRVQIIIESKVLVACIVATIVVLLLVAVNPPLAQSSNKPGKRSALKIGTWALTFGLLAFVLPTGASLFCQSGNAAVS